MKLKYFGTDGIRGQYGIDPISESFAKRIALGLISYLKAQPTDKNQPVSIALGRDTRFSGASLADAFCEAFESAGVRIYDLGVTPTPQVAFATSHFKTDLGLVITASHNPVADNGFKLFNSEGKKFTPEQELQIESHIDSPTEPTPGFSERASRTFEGQTVSALYFEKLKSVFAHLDLRGLRILIDTANGATHKTTPTFLEMLGAEVLAMGNQPDGHNINRGVGSEYPDKLRAKVLETKSDFGVAHDGDGDRIVFVDNKGEVLSGEHFMAIIARYSPSIACTQDRPFVTTSMSNFAINSYLANSHIETIRTDVGDRNVAYQMFDSGSLFGGENSGHYISADILNTGDGLVALLKLIEAIRHSKKTLCDLQKEMTLYPSRLLNLSVSDKLPLESLTHLQSAVQQAESLIDGKGRVMLRYSGTENKLRILVECESSETLESTLDNLQSAAKVDLDVSE